MNRTTLFSKYIAIILAFIILGYVFISNTVPFNLAKSYNLQHNGALPLSPSTRIKTSNGTTEQKEDLIYFSSPMAFKFNKATVSIAFKNNAGDQQILLGYQNQKEWHYNSEVLDEPFMNSLNWPKIGNGPFLYQKAANYNSTSDFFHNAPKNKVVGVYDFSNSDFLSPNVNLPDYKPAASNTTIDTALRGRTTLFTYLKNEPFDMSFTKRDLNWYADPDTAKISVYKGNNKVFDATIDDDGNTSSDHKHGPDQKIEVKNPGPGLPEAGVYKIVIDASGDSLITNITSNLHKVVFEGPLYATDNKEVYGNIIEKTKPTNLVTGAQKLSFRSGHGQSTTAIAGNQAINLLKPGQEYNISNSAPMTNISIPNSDMIVNGSGYFAFNNDQYFTPTPYKILPIYSQNDINQADFIITNYPGAPKREGNWSVATRTFDLDGAYVQNRQLNWILNAPSLGDNNNTIKYKRIEMTLTKKGWFKQ
jgi:hypothetical protein